MLRLDNIVKNYYLSGETIKALRGVSIDFRDHEFVSVLGPSGCGKTTLLNIIGGLDRYDGGEMTIDGRSTKTYRDRDWDGYRNHSVGFVFQSYNLIPHQTVLSNVELALTLSGVSRRERRNRAKAALEKVGLGDQLKKKPGEMSGGQMQRVAIARAIVNDPEIILADEPTGALDTETSEQVMAILKEISKDRLVVMVTHNPDLAERYSTRIINILDGKITGDTMPVTEEELAKEKGNKKEKPKKLPSMSLFTSFSLSLKNLFTKKGRTFLTAFAGSIGIVGIALIYSVSHGMTTYINDVQEDTLSSYPLTIESEYMDFSSLIQTFMGSAQSVSDHEKDAVYQRTAIYDIISSISSEQEKKNDLKSFKKFIEDSIKDGESDLGKAITGVDYTYDSNLLVYTENIDGEIIVSDTQKLMSELMLSEMNIDLEGMRNLSQSFTGSSNNYFMSSGSVLWEQLLPGTDGTLINDVVKKQYNLVSGSWADEYDEIMLVLDEKSEVPDLALYAMGLVPREEIEDILAAVTNKTAIEYDEGKKWSYDEILGSDFRTVLGCDCYSYDEATGTYTDLRETEAGLRYLYDNALKLRVSGIIIPNEDASSTMLNGTLVYTRDLTEYIIEKTQSSEVVKAQLASPDKDIFTGLPFKESGKKLTDEEKSAEFEKYISSLDGAGKAMAYAKIASIPPAAEVDAAVTGAMTGKSREDIEASMKEALMAQMSLSESEVTNYLSSLEDEKLNEMYENAVREQYKAQYAQGVSQQLAATPAEQLAAMLDAAMPTYTVEQKANLYDEVIIFSESTYEDNLLELSYCDLDSPSTVNLYTNTFENKDVITAGIEKYNSDVGEEKEITYTDYVAIIMSSVTTIINAISYVLIAFVAVSLIVSSIMVGVITLISVQERTKEIGILRAIGASKGNVSSMFNAETVIIGFIAGVFGIAITLLLDILVNIILHALTGIENLNAILPPTVALVLIGISVLLTLIAGIIPSRSAAKKDPVVALRTE